jgi:hypothetical protein
MADSSQQTRIKRPRGVTLLAAINGLSFVFTLAFWGIVALERLVPFPTEVTRLSERANAAITWGFLIGDVLFSAPLLLLATIGLYRTTSWGWTAAQMANILWIYSMTVVLTRDAYTVLSPGGILFLPFAIIAVWAIYYLWKCRDLFWHQIPQSSLQRP